MRKIAVFFVVVALIAGFLFSSQIENFIKNLLPSEETLKSKILALFDKKIREPALNAINQKIDDTIQRVAEDVATEAKKTVEKIITPPPLVKTGSADSASTLTRLGILTWTNIERVRIDNLPNLQLNQSLNLIAEARLKDMFANQYFDHNSPSGENASFEAKKIGYEYILIGENIALGNFENDEKLVEAWMNSPGHRANILNTKFTEIGIAVGEDIFEGSKRWIAVQIFAKPQSDCPVINANLKLQISTNKDQIDQLQVQASILRDELAESEPKTKNEAEAYNKKVDEYNALVNKINQLIDETKNQISEYNNQVNAFNLCAQG